MTIQNIERKIAQLQRRVSELHQARLTRQTEVAKSYADAFIRKLEADGIPLSVGLRALRDLAKLSTPQKPKTPSPRR